MSAARKTDEAFPWSLVFILFLVGVLFAVMASSALGDASEKFPLELINKQRAELAAWPRVEGHLDEVQIYAATYQRPRYPNGTDYWPEVKYQYSVGSKHYNGNCLRTKLAYQPDTYYCDDPITGLAAAREKLKAFLPANLPEKISQDKLGRKIRSYFPNSKVWVYYDPRNPARSHLDNNWPEQSWLDYYSDELLMGSFCAGIAIVMFAACALCLWVQGAGKPKREMQMRTTPSSAAPPAAIPLQEQWKVEAPITRSEEAPDTQD